ncbi:hypothetical protein [Pseudobacillus badius]|uniref:DinB/UmuC family translesion DNA polymerase n=1 Tax=Bacillus badius TaxID=1455 RepID=UPI003D3312CF
MIFFIAYEMVNEVSMGLRSHHAAGKIALGISYSRDIEERGFKHQVKLARQTNYSKDLNTQLKKLFKTCWRGQLVRQIYVACASWSQPCMNK